jgi:hypothetical protein
VRLRVDCEFRKFFRYLCHGARKRGWSDSQESVEESRPLGSFRARLRDVSAQVGRHPKQAATLLEIILRGLCRPVALQFGCVGPPPALRQRKAVYVRQLTLTMVAGSS